MFEPLDYRAYLLLATALLHLGSFAYFALRRPKDAIAVSYGGVVLFLAIWALDLVAFYFSPFGSPLNTLSMQLLFAAGLTIGLCFLLFAYYPMRTFLIAAKGRVALAAIYLLGLAASSPWLLEQRAVSDPHRGILVNLGWFTVWALALAALLLTALVWLYRKYRKMDGSQRWKVGAIMLSSSLGTASGILFDVILYYYVGDFSLYWLGPFITLGLFLVTTYIVFEAHWRGRVIGG